MNEEEWLASTDPQKMLEFLRGKTSDRKLRLFAVACCWRTLPLLRNETSRATIELAEQFADGRADKEKVNSVNQALWNLLNDERSPILRMEAGLVGASTTTPVRADIAATVPANIRFVALAGDVEDFQLWAKVRDADWLKSAFLVRDLFGPLPFRPGTLAPAWLTWNSGTIPKLAQAIYDERELPSGHLDAARLGVLADALEEAGCTDPEILTHLRGPGPHVRGCWVVDLLLGKS